MKFQYWDTTTGRGLNTTHLRDRYNQRDEYPQAISHRISFYDFIDVLLRDGSITDQNPAEPDTCTCDCAGCNPTPRPQRYRHRRDAWKMTR